MALAAKENVSSRSLIRYDTMCRAIDAAYKVDEVKEIRDKAMALSALEASCEHTWWFPSVPGAYVFDGVDGVLYIGESTNLRKRLANHERRYLRRSVGVRCRIVPCRNHKQVERWLIAELKPALNGLSESYRTARAGRIDGTRLYGLPEVRMIDRPKRWGVATLTDAEALNLCKRRMRGIGADIEAANSLCLYFMQRPGASSRFQQLRLIIDTIQKPLLDINDL